MCGESKAGWAVSLKFDLSDCRSLLFRGPIHITSKLHSIGNPQLFKHVEPQ